MNRGRIQSQGGRIEKSESWNQQTPISALDGKIKIKNLESKHNSTEQTLRAKSFNDARNFIDDAKKSGGVSAPVSKSYPVKNDRHRRVDIEVIKGVAFK